MACSTQAPAKDPNTIPSWVMNPSQSGKIGVAGRTYDQSISSQQKLAIKRVLNELSLQTSTIVSLHM
ncbi:MAG TPA: hypothetical protein EYO75_03635 [Sulfurimonas sp.]|nr:hypothetical protein [Sulfurimonas sp.]HIM75201.1 hypothetical protein [Campylobacterales bacterium]